MTDFDTQNWDMGEELDCEILRAILDTMAEAVYLVDPRGVIRSWNRGAERLTGYSADEVVGQRCTILRGDGCPDCPDAHGECPVLKGENVHGRECLITAKGGATVPVVKNARQLFDEHDRPVAVVETLADLRQLREAMARIRDLEDRVQDRTRLRRLIGKHALMQEVFDRIRLAAASEASVILTGESGTGKELAAEAIHHTSNRSEKPFVRVNCAALPETLLESELFGHVKGAFTGAVKDKPGRFELAHGGTIFLDEIGDVSPAIQMKLLRALQEKTFERLGEGKMRRADVRIITATNRDLPALVSTGEFREDLFYRINVFPIRLPALREHREDIPLLARHFLDRFARDTGKPVRSIAPEAMRRLMDHDWPGNVRQLENAIEHAFVTVRGEAVTPEDLPADIRLAGGLPDGLPRPRDDNEKNRIIEVLETTQWNRTRAAAQLGISRVTLWKRLKKYGITQADD